MKKLLLIIIIISSLLSCQDYQRRKHQQTIDEKIEKELSLGIRNDTIFLGLTFGMTEKEFNNKLQSLKKEGKIYLNDNNYYEYEFSLENNAKGEATFNTDYFENKLYELAVIVKSDDLIFGTSTLLLKLNLRMIYSSKYGYGSCLEKESILDNNSKDYIWINGNRMIEMNSGINSVIIFYTDLMAKNKKEAQMKEQEIEDEKTIIDDI